MKRKPDLIRRQEAVAATMAKYRSRKFDWKSKATCLHLARFHLRQMGKRPPALPQVGSLLAAKKALKARGWRDVGEMLDAIGLKRIPPASMLLGDLIVIDSDDGLGSIFVAASPHKMIGWATEAEGMIVADVYAPEKLKGAWRV